MFIEFTPVFEVGITVVDQQHKKLFEMLNALHAATASGEEQSALADILDELVEYTVYHFQTEEDLYVEHNFPDYDAHKKEHDGLTAQVIELQNQFREGSATISFDLLDFLHDWLVEHTTGLDQEMAPFLKERGVV